MNTGFLRIALEVFQLRQVAFQEGRAARRHHHDHAVDERRLRHQPREIGIAHLVHALRGRIDRVLRGAVGGNVHVDRFARLLVEHRHVQAGGGAGIRHPDAGAARTMCRCRRACRPAGGRRRRGSRRRDRSSRRARAPRSGRSVRTWRGRRPASRQAPRCARRRRGSPAPDWPILPTISGLPARSAFSATRLNFSGDLTSSSSSRKTSVPPSSSM